MKVLVTGGLGVNGVWVARDLLERGAEVVAMDLRRDFSLAPDLEGELEFVAGDVTDLRGILNTLRGAGFDAIAHLAILSPGSPDVYRGYLTNAMGTVNVLEAARLGDVPRVVFTSSKAVYSPFDGRHGPPDYEPVPETHPLAPLAAMRVYSSSKILCESAGVQFAEAYGLEFLALRFATIYGPGKKARHGPVGLHSRMIENAMLGEPTTIESGGEEADDMVYVKDVASSIALACTSPAPRDRLFNIGTGRVATLRDFAAAVAEAVPGARIEVGDGFDYLGFGRIYGAMDISLASSQLGYQPRFDLRAGVRDYVEETRELGLETSAKQSPDRW
jgi:UDP-glucose 4-epimerase